MWSSFLIIGDCGFNFFFWILLLLVLILFKLILCILIIVSFTFAQGTVTLKYMYNCVGIIQHSLWQNKCKKHCWQVAWLLTAAVMLAILHSDSGLVVPCLQPNQLTCRHVLSMNTCQCYWHVHSCWKPVVHCGFVINYKRNIIITGSAQDFVV